MPVDRMTLPDPEAIVIIPLPEDLKEPGISPRGSHDGPLSCVSLMNSIRRCKLSATRQGLAGLREALHKNQIEVREHAHLRLGCGPTGQRQTINPWRGAVQRHLRDTGGAVRGPSAT
jgi:hypothetical protein